MTFIHPYVKEVLANLDQSIEDKATIDLVMEESTGYGVSLTELVDAQLDAFGSRMERLLLSGSTYEPLACMARKSDWLPK